MPIRRLGLFVLVACFAASALTRGAAYGQASPAEPVQLIDAREPLKDWKFDNGQEFPGAKGGLTVDAKQGPEGGDCLKLLGDFTNGGQYVQLGRKLDKLPIQTLKLRMRNPGSDRFTLRLGDASGQTHQFNISTPPGEGWVDVEVPLERFFARRGQADAVTNVAKYESWGGAKDGNWHGPATGIYFLVGRPSGDVKTRTIWISQITAVPPPPAPASVEVRGVVPLDTITDGAHDWRLSLGEEVKGAKGDLTVVQDEPAKGATSLKLAADFTGGGAYVAAIKDLKPLELKEVAAFAMRYKTDNASSLSVQLVDGTGQTHQKKGLKLSADGQWHELILKPKEIAGGEHWGGAKGRCVARPADPHGAVAHSQLRRPEEAAGGLPGRGAGRRSPVCVRAAGGVQGGFFNGQAAGRMDREQGRFGRRRRQRRQRGQVHSFVAIVGRCRDALHGGRADIRGVGGQVAGALERQERSQIPR